MAAPHNRQALEQMLPEADGSVARGAARIRAQEARVAALSTAVRSPPSRKSCSTS